MPNFFYTRDQFVERLAAAEIGTGIYYPTPAHRQPALGRYEWAQVNLRRAELYAQQVVSIPVHPALTDTQRAKIVETIRVLTSI